MLAARLLLLLVAVCRRSGAAGGVEGALANAAGAHAEDAAALAPSTRSAGANSSAGQGHKAPTKQRSDSKLPRVSLGLSIGVGSVCAYEAVSIRWTLSKSPVGKSAVAAEAGAWIGVYHANESASRLAQPTTRTANYGNFIANAAAFAERSGLRLRVFVHPER